MPGGGESDGHDCADFSGELFEGHDCLPDGAPPTPARDSRLIGVLCWLLTLPVLLALMASRPVLHFDVNNFETRVMPLPAGGSPLWWRDDCRGCVAVHCFQGGFVPTVTAYTREYEWS